MSRDKRDLAGIQIKKTGKVYRIALPVIVEAGEVSAESPNFRKAFRLAVKRQKASTRDFGKVVASLLAAREGGEYE